ncbi:MAG: WD40 repeat domain-containing protein [Planctomycetota bacterium]
MYERREARRWDHVDGSILEDPFAKAQKLQIPAIVSDERVSRFSMLAARRGLRSGLWCEGVRADGEPVFLDGARLALVEPQRAWEQRDAARAPVLDLATLGAAFVDVGPFPSESLVRDDATLDRIAGWLGRSLQPADRVHRFAGVRELVVTLYGEGHGSPMLVLDPADGSVVARPKIAPDAWSSYRLGPFVHVPEHSLLLTSNGSGSTLEAISTETWEVVWREPWSSNNGLRRRILARGDRVYSYAARPSHADVHEVASGASIFDGSGSRFTSIDGSDDGRWVAASAYGALHLLDTSTFEPYAELWVEAGDAASSRVRAVAVDGTFDVPAQRIAAADVLLVGRGLQPAADVAPWLWDPLHVRSLRDDGDRAARTVKADVPLAVEPRKLRRTNDVAIADRAPIVAAVGRTEPLRILNAEDGAVLKTSTPDVPWAWNLDVSPDGETVALVTRLGKVLLWNWREEDAPARVAFLDGTPGWTDWPFGSHVSFAPDGRHVLVAHHRSERLLLRRSGDVVARIPRVAAAIELEPTEDGFRAIHASGFTEAVAWSPDGSRVALVTEGRPAIHDAHTGERIDVDFPDFEPTAESIAFGPEGRRIATGHFRGKVVLWDLETGEPLWIHEHEDPFWGKHDDAWNSMGIGDLAFSPDGASLALTTVTGIHAVLLDAETGRQEWIGPYNGGRMGEPAGVTWTTSSRVFYFAFVSGCCAVRRVDLRPEATEGMKPAPRGRKQFDLEPGLPVDLGWNGRAAGISEGAVVVREAVSGRVVWRR